MDEEYSISPAIVALAHKPCQQNYSNFGPMAIYLSTMSPVVTPIL